MLEKSMFQIIKEAILYDWPLRQPIFHSGLISKTELIFYVWVSSFSPLSHKRNVLTISKVHVVLLFNEFLKSLILATWTFYKVNASLWDC